MFKIGSFEEEIYKSMEKNLVSNQLEAKYGFDKLAKAADYLNAAAETFTKAGMNKEANEVLEVIKSMTEKVSGKK